MASAYQSFIQLIRDGENVESAVINQRLRELFSNTDYLKELFEAAALGSAVFARGVTVESDALPGQPVWYNPASSQFEQALSGVETDDDGQLVTTASSQVWGLVYQKTNATLADLVLAGYVDIDLSNAVSGDVAAGVYYLSGADAGKLQKTRPPLGVPVLLATGDGKVHVRPGLADSFIDHQHYMFPLVCRPAGVAALAAGRWTVDTPDVDEEGWLPADHASFGGKAPAGAAFGYNLAASSVGNAWPPLPLNSVYLEWNKGLSIDVGFTGVPLGPEGLAIADANGVWWMSDCEDDVPWPDAFDGTTTTTSTTTTTTGPPECPRDLQMELRLWFSRMTFQTADTAVTSLRIAEDSQALLTLTCLQTGATDKTGGDLEISIDLNLAIGGDDDTAGYLAVKTQDGAQLLRGPVVESIATSSSAVTLGGDLEAGGKHYGNVTIDVSPQAVNSELPITSIRLMGATEENIDDVLALGLPDGLDSGYRAEFAVPADLGVATAATLKLRFWLMGLVDGDLPELELSYRRLPRPGAGAEDIPTEDTALTLDLSGEPTLTARQYVEAETQTFAAAPGDVVQFTLWRAGDGGDGYAGEVHVLKQQPIITAVS